MMNTGIQNPYIGPRMFTKEERHLFFGRDREARDLTALVATEKMVLFYAQSGAGKSSLINTNLIPELEQKGFEVLPVGRVSGYTTQDGEVENIFVYNLFRSLLSHDTDTKVLSQLNISQFLDKLNEDELGYFFDESITIPVRTNPEIVPWPRALIIDQFEEIFSTSVEAWLKREDFFCQLAQAMRDDPYLWIILVMREDHIASLDPYAHLLPGGLRVRYYMERLSHDAAIQAVTNPVENLRPYAPGVAEKLVEDLSSINVQQPDGTITTQVGQYIEPVQLQVVCYSLWEGLSEGNEITEQDLQEVGDVDQSLGKYYDQRVSEVAKAKEVKERLIREWFEKKLITTGGVRSMVLQEREPKPGDLDDEVIQALQSDLVRAEKRGGATWYELTHDRLVGPIQERNKVWFSEHLSPLQRHAALWRDQGKNEMWLLRDQALIEVEKWAEEYPDEIADPEEEFLEACRRQQEDKELEALREREEREREVQQQKLEATQKQLELANQLAEEQTKLAVEQSRSARRARQFNVIAFSLVLLSIAGFIFAFTQANRATKNLDIAEHANTAAVQAYHTSEIDKAIAVSARNTSEANEKIARISLLSTQSNALLEKNTQLSTLIGIQMYQKYKDFQSQSTLLNSLLANPRLDQYLYGHSSAVLSVAFSPDGKTLASGSCSEQSSEGQCQKGEIILWDAVTGLPIAQHLTGHTDSVTSVAFSPSGKTLASGSNDSTILLWDVAKHQQIGQPLSGHKDSVISIAFSPDGKTLASGGNDSTINLWDVATGQPIGQPLTGHIYGVTSVAFSPDGKTLASGSYDQTIILWDVATGQPIGQPLTGHIYGVTSVAFSPDGKTLASGGSYDQAIILWDVATGQPIGSPLIKHSDSVSSVAFSPDGKTLASGSNDQTIILWDVRTGQAIGQPLTGHTYGVTSVAFSPDGKTLASGSVDKAIILWNIATGNPIGQPLIGHTDSVTSVAFSPDGKTLASGSYDQTIILWYVASGQPIGQPLTGHIYGVTSVAFSPDGKTLASGSADNTIILWEVASGQPIGQPFSGHEDWVNSVVFSPDGKTLASGSNDSTIILWDVAKHQQIGKPLSGHTNSVTSVAFSPDGKTLASGSVDNIIILWDAETGQAIGQPLTGHKDSVTSVAFSPDGKTLASGSVDNTIILWDVAKHQPIGQPLTGHTSPVSSLAFSPDGETLASGRYDQTIILWKTGSGESRPPLTGHTDLVNSVAFSPDGKTLASGSSDQTIILWDLDPEFWINKACQRVGRNFTLSESKQYFSDETYKPTCPQWPIEAALSPTTMPTGTAKDTNTNTPPPTATPVFFTTETPSVTVQAAMPTETEISLMTATPTGVPTSTPSPTNTPPPTATPVLYRVVNVTSPDNLNIRAGAGYKYNIVGKIPADGRGIQIIGDGVQADSATWVPILYNGISGWVNKYYIKRE